jgi:hypothetical protein
MKTYATNIEVNGDKAYFKDDVLTLNMTDNYDNYEMFATYMDGTTSRYGVTVQEVKEALENHRKIVLNTFEHGAEELGGGETRSLEISDRLDSKIFLLYSFAGHNDWYGDFYELHFPFNKRVTVWFDDEGNHGGGPK